MIQLISCAFEHSVLRIWVIPYHFNKIFDMTLSDLQNLCTRQGKKLKTSSIVRLLMQSPQHYYKPFDMPNKERFTLFGFCFLGAKILQFPVCSPLKFERHQLYGFSNMEVLAIFNVSQTVSAPIFHCFEKRSAPP